MDTDKTALVRVKDHIPSIFVELKYATSDNFMGKAVYDFNEALLRYGTTLRLKTAQAYLLERGCSLKLWDAYRPMSAQFEMWAVCPDDDYVADPTHGGSSRHNRGCAVDVTLVTADGAPLPMPTEFDDFAARPDRDYSRRSPDAAANARLLEAAMAAGGFVPYEGEWWHFNDSDPYPVIHHPQEES